jgi:hypothetical protein
MVDQGLVTQALADFTGVFAEIKPYQQKELMRLVLHKAILGPDYLKIGLYGRPPELGPLSKGEPRSQTFDWLPGQDSNPDQRRLGGSHLRLVRGAYRIRVILRVRVLESALRLRK